MSQRKIDQSLQTGIAHHQAGQLGQAEEVYRRVLALEPNHGEALHLLGVLAGQTGRHDQAADLFRKAIAASPRNPAYYANLGFSLMNLSQLDQAIAAYQQVISLQPNSPDAYYQIGNACYSKGLLEPAIAAYQRAIALRPNYFEALHNLGNALVTIKRFDQAIPICQHAIALNPNFAASHNNLGNAYKNKGELQQAIACYRQALAIDPNYAEAHNNLGNTLQDTKELDLAIACYRQAVLLNPSNPEFHGNLGSALLSDEQVDEAIESLQHALSINPDDPKALYNMAIAWTEEEEYEKAIDCHQKAIALQPQYFDALLNLGAVYAGEKQFKKGIDSLEQAIQLRPSSAEAYNNLGTIYRAKGDLDQAIACHQRAIELKPHHIEAYNNLGNALKEKRLLEPAIRCYQQAMTVDPGNYKILCGLGNAWKDAGRNDLAIECLQKALAIKSDDPDVLASLAGALQDSGEVEQSIQCFRQSLEIAPNNMSTHDGLLFTMLFSSNSNASAFFEQRSQWNRQFVQPVSGLIQPHGNDRNPNRPLRIGYLSPDFKNHPVGRFLLPLLASHDHDRFEIFGYANLATPDAMTANLRLHVDHWRNIAGDTDDEAAEIIRQDQIDILVDLAMHSANHRLMVFARKPAPVQVTYLAFAAGTGVETIDYRLTDRYIDPEESDDRFYLERSVRLSGSYWCYQQSSGTPQVGSLPALNTGKLTLGCLNKFSKVSQDALELWARLLQTLPNANLIMHLNTGSHQDRLLRFMADRGIKADRIEMLPYLSLDQYFATLNRMDITLDPFPCSGGTTTCDALWMGSPVVTLAGSTGIARASVSILNNAGFPELVAQTRDQYSQIVCDLAGDLPRLAKLRASIRPQMLASPLMDATGFARSIEFAYRTLWQRWCESH